MDRAAEDHPTRQPYAPPSLTVRTSSGSRYRIQGDTVTRLSGPEPGETFELVDITANRIRYTDGARLYISTPLVAA